FQAEDGIRDGHVTGVQTCALPIFAGALSSGLSYCIRSLPLISSLHGSAACAYGAAASAPSTTAVARVLRIRVMGSSFKGRDQSGTPRRLCITGLVVVYCRNCFFCGYR